jgi:aminoglycoside 6'-N-acetyltransferase I
MRTEVATAAHLDAWSRHRAALWDWMSAEEHRAMAKETYFRGDPNKIAFVALSDSGETLGFAEASLRRDYVEGCETSPVAFLEGIYVAPAHRKTGIAHALSEAVAEWGLSKGCSEYASNALLDNAESHAFHAAIGFVETERVVYFHKEIGA